MPIIIELLPAQVQRTPKNTHLRVIQKRAFWVDSAGQDSRGNKDPNFPFCLWPHAVACSVPTSREAPGPLIQFLQNSLLLWERRGGEGWGVDVKDQIEENWPMCSFRMLLLWNLQSNEETWLKTTKLNTNTKEKNVKCQLQDSDPNFLKKDFPPISDKPPTNWVSSWGKLWPPSLLNHKYFWD